MGKGFRCLLPIFTQDVQFQRAYTHRTDVTTNHVSFYFKRHPIKVIPTYQLGSLLASQRSGVVSLIPLPEWKAVNKDDAVLHQGLGSDQLVVGGIVDHINDPGLACAA